MMSKNHELLNELKQMCNNYGINPGKADLVFELYLELCEVYKLWNVEYKFLENLNKFYLIGKQDEKSEFFNVYVPVTADEFLSVKDIEQIQTYLSPLNKSLILVFKDRDSTSAQYRITNRLERPNSPKAAQRKKMEDKKFYQLNKNLIKWRKKLYFNALDNEKIVM